VTGVRTETRDEPTVVVSTTVDGPWGPVWIACGAREVVAVEMLAGRESFEARLARRGFGPPLPLPEPGSRDPAPVDRRVAGSGGATAVEDAVRLARRTRQLLGAFLTGQPAPLGSLPVDLADRSAWDRLVLDAVRAIPRGSTAGYGEVARRIGRPGAARAVGGAVGRNPIGLIVPCHRVIAGDGSLGGYGVAAWGGREAALDLKRHLLALEGVRIAD
jgi:O-6-methylguanine DNA methyltransferase